MKRVTLALLALASFFYLRADTDILVNSDFSDGHAHWKGDAQDPDPGAVDLGAINNGGSGGVGSIIINLKKDDWSKIYQSFTARSPKLYYTITYKLSPDYKLDAKDYSESSPADFSEVPGFFGSWTLSDRYWNIIVPGNSYAMKSIIPDERKKNKQETLTGRLTGLPVDSETVFLIAFPPGQGSITLYKAALSNNDPSADPTPDPSGN